MPTSSSAARVARTTLSVDEALARILARIVPLSWSRYSLERTDHDYRFVQEVGQPTRGNVGDVSWHGDEIVAFRVHLPSRVNFHNSPDFERGNILVWEQSLRDRLAGTSVTATEPIFGYMFDALGMRSRNQSFQLSVMNNKEATDYLIELLKD